MFKRPNFTYKYFLTIRIIRSAFKMTTEESQVEELEVLSSIYEGDESFKQISPTTFQYKYGEHETNKSFVVEIIWGPNYPEDKPSINLDMFYNRNLLQCVKDKIIAVINEEADQWIGSAMTYTLFECLKERVNELLEEQVQVEVTNLTTQVEKVVVDVEQDDSTKKAVKKEQLTKSQKRRAWDRAEVGKAGERPRGYDWVDIVKHLSQVPHTPTAVS